MHKENNQLKQKSQRQPQRETKTEANRLLAQTAQTATFDSEEDLSSEYDAGNESEATKEIEENEDKKPIKLGSRKYGCPFCSRIMHVSTNMKNHILTHTGGKPFSCDICGKDFNRKGNLSTHIMTHTGEKPFPCNNCETSFIQKAHLQNHLKKCHSES